MYKEQNTKLNDMENIITDMFKLFNNKFNENHVKIKQIEHKLNFIVKQKQNNNKEEENNILDSIFEYNNQKNEETKVSKEVDNILNDLVKEHKLNDNKTSNKEIFKKKQKNKVFSSDSEDETGSIVLKVDDTQLIIS